MASTSWESTRLPTIMTRRSKRRGSRGWPHLGSRSTREDLLKADLGRLFGEASVVFHLAGQAGVRPSWGADFRTYTDRNVLATQRLLEFVHRVHPVDRFVYASSSSVYGNAVRYPVTEASMPRPFSPYGVSKLAAEHLCGLYARTTTYRR